MNPFCVVAAKSFHQARKHNAVFFCLNLFVTSLNSNPPFSVRLVAEFHYLNVAQIEYSTSIVLIQSCNKQAVRVNVNKPSDANVCCTLCHNTEFIFVTHDPQITHGNKSAIENKLFAIKQGTLSETNLSTRNTWIAEPREGLRENGNKLKGK